MAAARKQKRVSASGKSTSARPRSGSRAPSKRARSTGATASRSTSARASTPRSRSAAARKPVARGFKLSRSVAPVFIAITLVLAAWMIYPVLRIQYQHERELQTLQGELSGLQSRNEELREQVGDLKTPEGVEQLARESLGMVKPGEQAYVVTGGVLGETTASVLVTDTAEASLWQRALDTLFGFR